MYKLYKFGAGLRARISEAVQREQLVGKSPSLPVSFPRSLPVQVAVLLHLRSSMVLMNSTAAVNCIHQ